MSLAIALFCGALLVLLWCGLLFEARHDRQIALGQARKDTSNLVVAFREHIGRTLSAIDQIMLVIKDEYHRDPEHYQLPDWLESSPLLAGMAVQTSIIGPDGFLRQTDLAGSEDHIDLSDRRHFRYHLDPAAPQPYISTPVVGRGSGRLSIQVSRRLEHADGSFAGVIVVSLDPFYLSQFFDTVDLGERGVVGLLGRAGIVRSRRSGMNSQIGQDLTDTQLFAELKKASSGTFVAKSKVDGVSRVYSYAAVPDYPLVVSIGIAVDEILAEPERERAAHFLFGVGISLVLVLLTALLLHEVALGRRREEEISAQASLTKTILDVTPSAIWVKDEQGRFEIVNDAMADVFKKRKEELIGRRTTDLLPPDEAERILAWDGESAVKEGVTIGGEHTLHVDGIVRRLLAFRRTCVLGGRSLVVGSAMDITLLRRAEEELRSEMRQREIAEAGLRQAQKMEAIGRLTGGVAHDFNNLLTSMLGNIELALRRVRDAPTLRLLQNAERAAQRGADLIQHLLAFARKQHLRTEPIDLNRLVLGMRDLLDRTIGLMIRIDTELDPSLWAALADANQVESAILNIAINARDAMPKGGRIVIQTANVAAGTAGLPPELVRADYVSIAVTDTGHGMTEEVLAMAFDPFFTTKDVGKGSGLGLSQVYGMVRQSGGTATIDSAPEQGTSVCLYLPRAPGEAQAPSPD
ncbi:MAG: PAS domain S-box protein, partial [Alphaproteobacteria bacterium]|nr:PAS domain S-box protein [Alphaproteobacteria bacterium]